MGRAAIAVCQRGGDCPTGASDAIIGRFSRGKRNADAEPQTSAYARRERDDLVSIFRQSVCQEAESGGRRFEGGYMETPTRRGSGHPTSCLSHPYSSRADHPALCGWLDNQVSRRSSLVFVWFGLADSQQSRRFMRVLPVGRRLRKEYSRVGRLSWHVPHQCHQSGSPGGSPVLDDA